MTQRHIPHHLGPRLLATAAALALGFAASSAHAIVFTVTNLASDGSVPAAHIDPNLINPWGISFAPTSPFWISDNNSGFTSLKTGGGAPFPALHQVPFPAAANNPTGTVFNSGLAAGAFASGGNTPIFLFAGEDGHISSWSFANGAGPTQIDFTSKTASVFKGLAEATTGGNSMLYATDFRNNAVDMFTNNFATETSFTDPTVMSGFAPFNAQVLDGQLYVTFALQDAAKHDDVSAPGNGYVDVFNLDGTLNHRIASFGDPNLDSPWGLAIAPSNWGKFAGKLLVGNFGDGTVNVYDQTTNTFLGKLDDKSGNPIALGDLWALTPGNGSNFLKTSSIYFTSGVVKESGGLFGALSVAPEPGSWTLMIAGLGLAGVALRAGRRARGLRAG
jgi:uncharacterized protein (TIGR03118 family)